MPDSDDSGQRPSRLLDAVFERLQESPDRAERAHTIFRAEALERLDVAEEIDNRLSLVDRRSWLVLLGALLVCAAALVWAAATPTQRTINGVGRVVDMPGVTEASSANPGMVDHVHVVLGDAVDAGQALVEVVATTGERVVVRAAVDGTVWQVLVAEGDTVAVGDALVSLVPSASGGVVLVAVSEDAVARIRTGMVVDVGSALGGVVEAVGAPLPADVVARRLGHPAAGDQTAAIVAVRLDGPLPYGQRVSVRIIESSRSILRALFGAGD